MSKIKPRRALVSKEVTGFSGLGNSDLPNSNGASDICNFRIRADGTLETRSGSRLLMHFSDGSIRGMWEGTVNGTSYFFIVAGNQIYRLTNEGSEKYPAGTLDSSVGNVTFCLYNDLLLLLDGSQMKIFRSEEEQFDVVVPYAPLIGYNWHPTNYGEEYESVNLLTPRMRIHFLNSTGSTVFYLPYYPQSIDRILVDGKEVTDYTFTINTNYVTLPRESVGTIVEIAFSVDLNTTLRKQILASPNGYVDPSKSEESLLLYGGSEGNRLYISTTPDGNQVNYSHLFYNRADAIYFTGSDTLFLGDTLHPITAICPYYDAMLVLNSRQTWLLEKADGKLTARTILNGIGNSAPGAALLCDGHPILIHESGIFRLSSTRAQLENPICENISDSIKGLLPSNLATSAVSFWDAQHNELWLRALNEDDDIVWIWNAQIKQWYRFSGLQPSMLYTCSFGTLFAVGNLLNKLDEQQFTDSGNSYSAYYQSAYFDFSHAETQRRSVRAVLCANPRGCTTTLVIENERGTQQFQLPSRVATSHPQIFDVRLRPRRHRFLRFRISTIGTSKSSIYKLSFFSNA